MEYDKNLIRGIVYTKLDIYYVFIKLNRKKWITFLQNIHYNRIKTIKIIFIPYHNFNFLQQFELH